MLQSGGYVIQPLCVKKPSNSSFFKVCSWTIDRVGALFRKIRTEEICSEVSVLFLKEPYILEKNMTVHETYFFKFSPGTKFQAILGTQRSSQTMKLSKVKYQM